ncbi:MAG TPA: hypothetical protein VHS97_16450 [Isosphaeraceae bacterium]|nr:hypothetical protein [Isosphaeraceae bacterium]
MEAGSGIFDHDLDAQPRRRIPTREDPPYEYQRLVVNPFLTVLIWIIFSGLHRGIEPRLTAAVFVAVLVVFVLGLFLVQFHCLDCGATGWLVRYQRHACPKVVARWRSRVVRRFHGPRLRIQLIAWLIVTMAALLLGALALGSR